MTNAEPLTADSASAGYSYNNVNQLTNTGYTYDADGNMAGWFTPEGYHATATYDAENRLKTVDYNDFGIPPVNYHTEFTYGGDGLLVKQVIDGVDETRFVRAGYLVLQERSATNEVTRSYAWDGMSPGGIGGLLELTQDGAHYNYLYDGKGNVSAVIDSLQGVAAKYRYDSFGVLRSQSGFLEQPYQFSTKPYLAPLGIVKYEYRDYLPTLGRWAEHDPMGEAADLNLYRAMGNSAVNYVDPHGLHQLSYGGNPVPHRHDPNNPNNIQVSPLRSPEFEGYCDATEDIAYWYVKAMIALGGATVAVETGSWQAGFRLYEFANFAFDYLMGNETDIPEIPVLGLVNPPPAEGNHK